MKGNESFIITIEVIEWISSSSHDTIKLLKVQHSISISIGLL